MTELVAVAILTIVFATALLLGPAWILRKLARRPFYWTFTPENTFCVVVSEEDNSGDGARGSGNVVNALHGVSGKTLDMISPDRMKWKFKRGEDPKHRRFLYKKLGIQSLGNIFWTLRLNEDKRMRFSREKSGEVTSTVDGEEHRVSDEKLHTVTKMNKVRHVYYSGELTVLIEEADTADGLGIDFEIDFIFERQFPVRSVLRLADSAAFVTSMVERIVNGHTVNHFAEEYVGGGAVDIGETKKASSDVRKNRADLAKAIATEKEFSEKMLNELGLNITSANIRVVTMPPAQRELLMKRVTATKEAEVAVIKAKAAKDAKVLQNDAEADYIERVVKPSADDGRTVEVTKAHAYRDNQTITTYVEGGGAGVLIGNK